MKAFIVNAINSWATSAGGLVAGLWLSLGPLFDSDPETAVSWGGVASGVVALIGGMLIRDHTAPLIKSTYKK